MNRYLNLCANIKSLTRQPLQKLSTICFGNAPKPLHCTINHLKPSIRQFATPAPINLNLSALAKDVIVFKYNNPRYFKLLNVFALIQFVFWLGLAEFNLFSFNKNPDHGKSEGLEGAENENLPDSENIQLSDENVESVEQSGRLTVQKMAEKFGFDVDVDRYRLGISIVCFTVGFGLLSFAWLFSLKNVRYLILRKGGATVSIVSYGPFGNNRILNVPLTCISGVRARETESTALPIKIKNKSLYYILDKRGVFTNPEIFDHVINIRRRL